MSEKKPILPNTRVNLGAARAVGKPEDRTLRFIGTDETRDRYNTFFKRDGWDFDNFRKNPVFLFHHNYDQATPTLPIGRVVNIDKTNDSGSPGWAFDVQFASREIYPFADVVYQMYREGFMNAVSVGFLVKQARSVTDEAEQKALGFDKGYAEVYERTELTELSAVPVPGNQNALIQRDALPRMRALLPEAYRATFNAEDGAELDGAWLGAQLARVAEALEADRAAACAASEPVITTDVINAAPTPLDLVTTNTARAVTTETPPELKAAFAEPAITAPPTRAEFLEAVSLIADNFTKLFRDLADLRADVRAARVVPTAPAPAPALGVAPVVPLAGTKTGRAPATPDAVEQVLGENVEWLRKLSVFRV